MIKFDFDMVAPSEHVALLAGWQIENFDLDDDGEELSVSGIIHNTNDLNEFESFFQSNENDVDIYLEMMFLEKFQSLGYKTFENDVDTFGISLSTSEQVLNFLNHIK